MRSSCVSTRLLALLALLLPCTPLPASEPVAAELQAAIPRLLAAGDVPGLSVAVVRGPAVTWHGAFGVKDAVTLEPADEGTVFEAASLTKPVVAYAALELADQGRLDLDAPLSRYVREPFADDPRLPLVTARRVLTHTTGFPNWRPRGQPLKMHFAPGERFSYSGEGFGYLQKAIEQITGGSLEAAVRALVFEPLGMTDSSLVWQERFEGRKATGHDAAGTPLPPFRPPDAHAASTLHTTAVDYGRFLAAALEGRGLRRRTAEAMGSVQIHVDEACSHCTSRPPSGRLSREIGWGLGWGIEETAAGRALWHWGDNGSGFHCYVAGDPVRKVGVVVFTNGLAGHGIIPEIVGAVLGRPPATTAWLRYERWDSPSRLFFKDLLARGIEAVNGHRELTEPQVNSVGYWLIGKRRLPEAIAVFERNVALFPSSWNAHDSLGEAYAAADQKECAVASYRRSLELNPNSASGADALRKLGGGS